MRAKTFYIYLSLLTFVLSASYLVIPRSILSLIAPLVSLFLLAYLNTEKLTHKILLLVPILISTYFNIYSIFPLINYSIAIFLLLKGKLTFYRALFASAIISFSFPLGNAFSSYNVLLASLFVLQASALSIVKETIYPGKRTLGVLAYSIPFAFLLVLAFGRWIEMIVIISIAVWAYGKVGREVIRYESVLKALTIFSMITFISYVLPIYVIEINPSFFQYFAVVTGF